MSIALTARELAQMRKDIADLLPDVCDILSVAYTPDGEGGFGETWGVERANVPCRVDYRSGGEKLTGAALQSYNKAILSLPYRTDLSPKNRIKVGEVVWAVISVNDGQSWQAVRRAELERVQ